VVALGTCEYGWHLWTVVGDGGRGRVSDHDTPAFDFLVCTTVGSLIPSAGPRLSGTTITQEKDGCRQILEHTQAALGEGCTYPAAQAHAEGVDPINWRSDPTQDRHLSLPGPEQVKHGQVHGTHFSLIVSVKVSEGHTMVHPDPSS
jgi:hypothetical protein